MRPIALLLIFLAVVGLAIFLAGRPDRRADSPSSRQRSALRAEEPDLRSESVEPAAAGPSRAATVAALRTRLEALSHRAGAREGQVTLHFKDEAAYRRFLERAARKGIKLTGRIDRLHSVRLGTDALDALSEDLADFSGDYSDVAANYLVGAPGITPAAQERAARTSVPLKDGLLSFLGATGDISSWGRGVTIAVIDSGIQADPTFGTGRLQSIDLGLGTTPGTESEAGHGTAVAALAAGARPDAQGVAPSAKLLSIRVTDDSGTSDIFTVAEAIVAAVDRGAQVINISLGSYATTATLEEAICYAVEQGSLIVSAAGNDQAAQLAYPAADTRVVSVGAVDALGQQVIFSNSGSQLQITAPGYGVQTAWTDGSRVYMDGTSASTPIVSGAIAAMMSSNPGITATDAWKILQQYASDGGPAGADPDYGNGVINLGWAMARNDTSRIDTAISSHSYDAASGTVDVVVQNRSGQAVSNLTLDATVNGAPLAFTISWLNPGAEQVIRIPVQSQLASSTTVQVLTQLTNPIGVVDQVPANNRRASAIAPATTAGPK